MNTPDGIFDASAQAFETDWVKIRDLDFWPSSDSNEQAMIIR